MAKFQERWFPLSSNFYQNEKIWDAGPAAALCFQYLCSKAHTDSDDGWVELDKWNPSRIWRWSGVLQDKFTKEEMADGIASLSKYGLVELSDNGARPARFDEWDKDKVRELTRERVRRHRAKGKESTPDCNAKNVTCNAPVTSSNADVTQCNDTVQYSTVHNSTEHNRERENAHEAQIFTSEVKPKPKPKPDQAVWVQDDTVDKTNDAEFEAYLTPLLGKDWLAWAIMDAWRDYPPHMSLETSKQIRAYYESRIDLRDTMREAIAGWTPGRTLTDRGGLHAYLNSYCSNALAKKRRTER
jgi:hypothetical protein